MKNARRMKKRNGLIKLLFMVLVFTMFLNGTAYAAESAKDWNELTALVQNADEAIVITLTKDMTADSLLSVGSGVDVTIDLAGKTIERGNDVGTIFSVNGGKLTIKDSAKVSVDESPVEKNKPV